MYTCIAINVFVYMMTITIIIMLYIGGTGYGVWHWYTESILCSARKCCKGTYIHTFHMM